MVYDYANIYFDFPQNHTMVIEDAITFVDRAQGPESRDSKYDYIVHDVFTGGAEPVDLFAYEFLTGLYNLLKRDGKITIVCCSSILLVLHAFNSVHGLPPSSYSSSAFTDYSTDLVPLGFMAISLTIKFPISFTSPPEGPPIGSNKNIHPPTLPIPYN